MSPSMRLRFRGCANNLNRNVQKTEQTLAKRLTCDVPNTAKVEAEAVNDVPESQVEDFLRQTQAKIDTYRNRISGNRPAQTPQPQFSKDDNKRLWGQALMDTLAELDTPVKPAPGT